MQLFLSINFRRYSLNSWKWWNPNCFFFYIIFVNDFVENVEINIILDLVFNKLILLSYQIQVAIILLRIFWSLTLLFIGSWMSFLENNISSLRFKRVCLINVLNFKLSCFVLLININNWAVILRKIHFVFLIYHFFWVLVELNLILFLSLEICNALLKITEGHFMNIFLNLRIWSNFYIPFFAHF